MQIGSEMATLQEKNPKMDPKKTFFSEKSPRIFSFCVQDCSLLLWLVTELRSHFNQVKYFHFKGNIGVREIQGNSIFV